MKTQQQLYKVLVNGESVHNGKLTWSLPIKKGRVWIPGEWHTVKGELKICRVGLHLTTKPYNWFKWGCDIYEVEAKGIAAWDEDKCVARSVRLLKPIPKPAWLKKTEAIIADIPNTKFLKPDGKPLKSWKVFYGGNWDAAWDAAGAAAWAAAGDAAWDAAWDAAGAAARDAAGDAAGAAAGAAARDAAWDAAGAAAGAAAWDAAGDAVLLTRIEGVCSDLKIDPKHRRHVKARWRAWQKGYAVRCDVNGVLYVYAVKPVKP